MVQQVEAAAAELTSCRMAILVGPPRLGIQKKPLVSRPSSAALVRALHTHHNNSQHYHLCHLLLLLLHPAPIRTVRHATDLPKLW
jgi:hypothetical protein